MKLSMIIEMTDPQSNGKLIVNELLRQGHEVQSLDMTQNPDIIIKKINVYNPTCVLGTHTHRSFTGGVIEKIKKLPCHPLTVLWYVDGYGPNHPVDKNNFEKSAGAYDLVLCGVKGLVEELLNFGFSKKVVWTPQYYDPTFYGHSNFSERTDSYDVCFIGSFYPLAPDRPKFITALSKKYKIIVNGYIGYNRSIGHDKYNGYRGHGGYIQGKECSSVYLSSKISFDTNKNVSKSSLLISSRVFMCMANGCLFLAPPTKDLDLLFIPGKHLDTYDGTIEGLCEKVDYYLAHDEERKTIARQGMLEIFEKHTIAVRVKEYIKEIKEML